MEATASSPTSDERALSALGYFLGLIVALVVRATHKDRSRFVRFHSVQAIAFDILLMVFMMLFVAVLFVGMFLVMAVGLFIFANAAEQDSESVFMALPLLTTLPFFGIFSIIPVSLGVLVVRIIAAVRVFQGHNFHYPWLGCQVEKFLEES
ncbi:MAG: DUF4870 domain-containing protein [Chloroflexota bacterium]|nr:MAG: DUF4870 domain-containing protein [Chloroflexota bacterium]